LPWLRRSADVVKVDWNGDTDLQEVNAELILVFGGDGSIISAARRLRGNPIPVMGVNMGHLGFLAETSPDELRNTLPAVLRGEYVLSPRMMLEINVEPAASSKKKSRTFFALNEVALLRQPMAPMMAVRVRVSNEEIAVYRGDGLIVSTATGSTGYCLSAGGPILSERLKALIVVPVCPHTLANRPIVLSGDESVHICATTRTQSPVELVVDGQSHIPLMSGTEVLVTRAPHEFNLVTLGKKGRYEIIRDKLHWAGWIKETQKAEGGRRTAGKQQN